MLANEHFTSVINLVDTVLDIGLANCDLKVFWRVGIRNGACVVDVVDNDRSGTIDYNEFVEDLKHVDEQQGGFMGDPDGQKKTMQGKQAAKVVNLSDHMFS